MLHLDLVFMSISIRYASVFKVTALMGILEDIYELIVFTWRGFLADHSWILHLLLSSIA